MDANLGLDQDLINAVAAITEASCACKDGMKKEELVGGQKKLDKNGNGKLDADDFKKLRKEETVEESVEEGIVDYVKNRAKEKYHDVKSNRNLEKHAQTSESDPKKSQEYLDKASHHNNKRRELTKQRNGSPYREEKDKITNSIKKLTKEQVEEIEALAAKHGLGE
jgi:hypothetical protein